MISRRILSIMLALSVVVLIGTVYVVGPLNSSSTQATAPSNLAVPSAGLLAHMGHPDVPASSPENPSALSGPCPLPVTQCFASLNWSGYAILSPTGSGVTAVSASWKVPRITNEFGTPGTGSCISTSPTSCPPGIGTCEDSGATCSGVCPDAQNSWDSNAVWIGIDGFDNGYVEQTGTSSDCFYGGAANPGVAGTSYYAWYEFYPGPSEVLPIAVHPGDTMVASVTCSAGYCTTTITDTTDNPPQSGSSPPVPTTAGFPMASAEFIDESPYYFGFLGLTPVNQVEFTGASATINGVTHSLAGWDAVSPTGVCSTAPYTNCVVWIASIDYAWPTNPIPAYEKAQPSGYFGSTFYVKWISVGP